MPDHEARLQARLLGDAEGGHRGRDQRRLADVGRREALRRPAEADLRERVAEDLVGLLEGAPGDRVGGREGLAHPDHLGALAREHGDDHATAPRSRVRIGRSSSPR